MVEVLDILIIGTSDYSKKINDLFLKKGFNVSLATEKNVTRSPAGIVIEVTEGSLQQKAKTLQLLASNNSILATTANSGITQVGAFTGHLEKTIGLHFVFNQFEDKCLVEMAKGIETSKETIDTCRNILEKTGAAVVLVEDVPGLIVDRVMASVINEAAYMLETKFASMEDINRIPKLCLNWPAGPFEFADLIGIDKIVATLGAASQYGTQYLPCRLLRNMVGAGRLGRRPVEASMITGERCR